MSARQQTISAITSSSAGLWVTLHGGVTESSVTPFPFPSPHIPQAQHTDSIYPTIRKQHQPTLVSESTYISQPSDLYSFTSPSDCQATPSREDRSGLHDYTSPEVMHKPCALSRVFLPSSGGKSIVLVKKKASSRSGILLSMHVVLKTRHVNPNIHVRRY